jgi:hypothetical protein
MTIEAQRTATFKHKITRLLDSKRAIDLKNVTTNNMQTYDRWLIDAVELLLQRELEQL